jgi:hypothetical protein
MVKAMFYTLVAAVSVVAYGFSSTDSVRVELLDDFKDGDRKNERDLEWFEFVDTVDGGNSEILDFTTSFKDSDSNRYARFSFILGDKLASGDKDYVSNYVGIGTDIASPEERVKDLTGAVGVRFRARSNDSLVIFFEVVTSSVDDNLYHRSYFIIDSCWRTFTVDFNDTTTFRIPFDLLYYGDSIATPLDYRNIRKFNWQIADLKWLSNSNNLPEEIEWVESSAGDTCVLCIDDVCILWKIPVKIQLMDQVKRPKSLLYEESVREYDLLGRSMEYTVPVAGVRIRGMYGTHSFMKPILR